MMRERSWRCSCGAVNADTRADGGRVGTCSQCFEYRPDGKAGRATVAADRLRAGDAILGGYELDGNLMPTRRYVGRTYGD